MSEQLDVIHNLDGLRGFVHQTLCHRENILADQFGITETPLLRNGRHCGLHFFLHGPRSIRLEAIWVVDHNQIFFYDACGNRFLKIQLQRRFSLCAA